MKKNIMLKAIVVLFVVLTVFLFGNVYAASEDYIILQKSDSEYLIYLKNSTNSEFDFVYTNEVLENDSTLNYLKSAKDKEGGLSIAYVDKELYSKFFKDKSNTYLWAKNDKGYIVKGVKLNLKDNVTESKMEFVKNTTKRIPVTVAENAEKNQTLTDGTKYTFLNGKIVINSNSNISYYYTLTDISTSVDYANLMGLAEALSKESDDTVYILENTKNFYDLYTKLLNGIKDEDWIKVENNEIQQPFESRTGDKYIAFIKQVDEKGDICDAQFMVCAQEEKETQAKIVKTTEKLPITYDNLILFIVLGIAVALLIVLVIIKRKNVSKAKNEK